MEAALKINLQPDTDAMRRHILVMFGAATSGLVELAWISVGRGSGARLFDLTAIDDLVEQAASWNLEGRNIYYGVTLKHPDTAPFGRTSDTDADAATAFWADFDEAGSADRADRLARKFPPTFRVTTGTVPHVRQHFYWLLDEAVRDMAHARAQVSALAATLGGDPTVVNPGRLMRLAGSIAWPTKPGRVAQLVTMTEGGTTYTADMIARAVPFGATVRSETRAARADLTFDAAAPQLPAGTGAKPQPGAAGTGSLGVLEAKLEDGRQDYMIRTIAAVLREFIGTHGAAPTEAELYDAAWPQYDRKVDWRSRPGRGPDEFRQKVALTLRRFHGGRIKGLRNEEEAVASYEARQRPTLRPGPTAGQQQASGHGGGFEAAAGGQGAQANRIVRLPLLYASEVTAAEPALDFVEGLLVEGGMSVWYGDSNVGKTFAVLDLAMHIALGRPYRGREIDQGGVVYCALEGVAGIRNRVVAWMRHHWVKPGDRHELPLAIVPSAINMLDTEADVPALIDAIAAAGEQIRRPVKWIVLDTLSRALAGGNENSPEDMGALVRSSDLVRQACGGALAYVHHSGKDQARGARGHSLLRAATDTEIEIARPAGSQVSVIKVTKQRELEIGEEMGFSLEVVDLGTNRRGKPLTSCVAVPAGAEQMAELAKSKNGPRARGKYQPGMVRVLHNLLATDGVAQLIAPKPGMSPQRCIRKSVWQEECYVDSVLERGKKGRDAWGDATAALVNAGIICMTEEWVWKC
jgi:hypothetical protein